MGTGSTPPGHSIPGMPPSILQPTLTAGRLPPSLTPLHPCFGTVFHTWATQRDYHPSPSLHFQVVHLIFMVVSSQTPAMQTQKQFE